MSEEVDLAPSVAAGLSRVADELQAKYHGTFGIETVRELVFDSYRQLAASAKVTKWLVIGSERLPLSDSTHWCKRSRVPARSCHRFSFCACTTRGDRKWHLAGSRN
ncbi:MAG: hypothetical protein JWM55_1326 [Acidimicrobiaceae bacterium]|nr:hypothetical protein [Acidimicrobiaceae bacterium]